MRTGKAADDFDSYVAAHGPDLERYAYVLTGQPASAEDLVQSALMKVYRHWRRVSMMEFPDAYVRRIVTTTFLDQHRRRSNAEQPIADVPDFAGGPDPALGVADRDQVTRALSCLSAQQRAVIVLRHYLGRDDAEIAAELGCTETTVRSHASRALHRMRHYLTSVDLQERLP
ncbi:MAG: SigE family RNA polymerase sigma factor [Actinomycetota bacterium]|nr:SigE family RNA polymerase sigma factor [Actinomycetota bacterium]